MPNQQKRDIYLFKKILVIASLALVTVNAVAWTGYPPAYPAYFYGQVAQYRGPAVYAPPAWRYPVAPAYPGRSAGDGAVVSGANDAEVSSVSATLPAALADDDLPVEKRKRLFIAALLPVVRRENSRLLGQRRKLVKLQEALERGRTPGGPEQYWLKSLAQDYDVTYSEDTRSVVRQLLKRVDAIPAGLVIAQAANESAWGRSRFAREGNNLFGMRTVDDEKGMKPRQRAPGKTHLVRSYDSIEESVRSYLHNLNSHPAYQDLRTSRARQRARDEPLSALQLAGGLVAYSELGDEYVERIQGMIRDNDLEQVASVQGGTLALLD